MGTLKLQTHAFKKSHESPKPPILLDILCFLKSISVGSLSQEKAGLLRYGYDPVPTGATSEAEDAPAHS